MGYSVNKAGLSPYRGMDVLELSSDRLVDDEEEESPKDVVGESSDDKETQSDFRYFRNGLFPRQQHLDHIFQVRFDGDYMINRLNGF